MKKYLFLITIGYFALGFVNILFGWLGLICMTIPLILLFKTKRKLWCQKYCPRAELYNVCGKKLSLKLKTPKFFIFGKLRWIVLTYFSINLFIIIMSSVMVAKGKPPMEFLRFLFFFPLPNIPQLFVIDAPNWIIHFGYRMYSMMFSTTIVGLVLAFIYKPRTWCTICPIATVSDAYIKSSRKKALKNNN